MTMTEYQGHKNKTHWNVALCVGNDEPLYREAVRLYRSTGNAGAAARLLMRDLPKKTPDGYRYSHAALRAAIVGLEISL